MIIVKIAYVFMAERLQGVKDVRTYLKRNVQVKHFKFSHLRKGNTSG